VPAACFALAHAGIGDWDRSFEWLERSIQARDGTVIYFDVLPGDLRFQSDPRFQDMIRRVGLWPASPR